MTPGFAKHLKKKWRKRMNRAKGRERRNGFNLKVRMGMRMNQLMLKMTRHEWRVYLTLEDLDISFKPQKGFIIDKTIVIVDFCIGNTIIEIDGSTHVKHEQAVKDAIRDASFQELGYRVFRITNQEVDDMTAAQLEHFLRSCVQRTNDTELEGAPS